MDWIIRSAQTAQPQQVLFISIDMTTIAQRHADPLATSHAMPSASVSSSAARRRGGSLTSELDSSGHPRYAFGKKVEIRPATTMKGTGHCLPVRQASDADFVAPPSSFRCSASPSISNMRRATTARTVHTAAPVRDTVVNRDAVKRVLELEPADVAVCTEMVAPLYSSFKVQKICAVPTWGPRKQSSAFKPFVGEARVRDGEQTEFTTQLRSSILEHTSRAASMGRAHVSASRQPSLHQPRHISTATTDRTGGWLRRVNDTPGPGSYFIP